MCEKQNSKFVWNENRKNEKNEKKNKNKELSGSHHHTSVESRYIRPCQTERQGGGGM